MDQSYFILLMSEVFAVINISLFLSEHETSISCCGGCMYMLPTHIYWIININLTQVQ